jgi:hypothetical protein
MTGMYTYRIHRFIIESEIFLPHVNNGCDVRHPEHGDQPIKILLGKQFTWEFSSIQPLEVLYNSYVRTFATNRGLLVCVGDGIHFEICRDGSEIIAYFDPGDHAQLATAMSCLTGLILSICVLLRSDIPLHAAAVEMEGKLVAMTAPSGTGKSTLLWSLIDRGAKFVTDDVLTIHTSDGTAWASPSYSLSSKLCSQTLEHRLLDSDSLDRVLPHEEKYWMEINDEARLKEPRPLAALFVLQPRPPGGPSTEIDVCELRGSQALSTLFRNIHGLWSIYDVLDAQALFRNLVLVSRNVSVYSVSYVRDFTTLSPLNDRIRNIVRTQ